MLRASVQATTASTFVAAEQLGSGKTAVAVAAPPPALKTRSRDVGFQLLCGSAQTLYPSLEAGATGGVLALATFAPQACQEVYTAWKENDATLAADKQRRIMRAGIEVCGQMGIPGVKYALDLNGYYGGRPRMPLLPLVAEEQRIVEELTFDIRN
jgi:4-hydroxy-2-oxoglutarate aldolase